MMMTPKDVAQDIGSRLIEGASSRKSAMHSCVVGTADGDLRVMVLREFDAETCTLRFHTDVRSPKVDVVRSDPAMHVLAYDSDAKIQIRMRGSGKVEHEGPIADAAWADATNFAKRCYLAEAAPGSDAQEPVSGLPEWAEGINPSDEQVVAARANFAVLLVEVKEFDWLYLDNDGHRRARIAPPLSNPEAFTWLVP